jgi:hypothetical protein
MRLILKTSERLAEPTSPSQAHYERILDEAATIRRAKVLAYGEGRYQTTDTFEETMLSVLFDIKRKHNRLGTVTDMLMRREGTIPDGETLRDTLLDLANYAIMGVQILDNYHKE